MRMLTIAALALAAAGCNGRKPRPPQPPASQDSSVSVAVNDPLRRSPAPNRLSMWDRNRYLHFYTDDWKPFDVAFLDASGTVVETGRIQNEIGITSKTEVRHALFQSGLKVGETVLLPAIKIEPMPAIKVGGHVVHVETSHTLDQRQRGLMHRPRLSKDDGMLFLYPTEDERSFWMKNTLIALDIAYFDAKGNLVNVWRMKPAADPARDGGDLKAPSAAPARFVLEVNYGWFDARGLIDAEGKPTKPVLLEAPDSVRRLADQAE